MPDSAGFALHRPELAATLLRGEEKIAALPGWERRTLRAGEVMIEADTEHGFVYRLHKGWTGRIRILPDGRSQYILIFLPGDLFGVKSMFVRRHPDAVETLSESEFAQIDHRRLRDAFDADSDIARRCVWQVIEEERRLHNWVVGLGRGSAEEKLALLLEDFRGRLVLSQTISPDALEFDLPMTQSQLGDHIGLSAVHVNRTFKILREQGIATMRGGRVTIHDLEALAQLGNPLLDYYERTTPAYGGEPGKGQDERRKAASRPT